MKINSQIKDTLLPMLLGVAYAVIGEKTSNIVCCEIVNELNKEFKKIIKEVLEDEKFK